MVTVKLTLRMLYFANHFNGIFTYHSEQPCQSNQNTETAKRCIQLVVLDGYLNFENVFARIYFSVFLMIY